MAGKLSTISRIFLTLTGFAVLAIVLFIGWFYYQMKFVEPRTCDHIPSMLTNDVELVKISEKEYETYPSNPTEVCGGEVARNALEAVASDYKSIAPNLPAFEDSPHQPFCSQYRVSKGILYLILPTTDHQYLILEKNEGTYELIFQQIMWNSPVCNASTIDGIRINDNQIVFTYAGFENPIKYLKLTFIH